jgi:hypothetical protein
MLTDIRAPHFDRRKKIPSSSFEQWLDGVARNSCETESKPSANCTIGQVEAVLGYGVQYRSCDFRLRQVGGHSKHHASLEPPTYLRVQA